MRSVDSIFNYKMRDKPIHEKSAKIQKKMLIFKRKQSKYAVKATNLAISF